MSAIRARNHTLHPPALTPGYKSSLLRAPAQPLAALPAALADVPAPRFAASNLGPLDHDLLRNFAKDGAPFGERILVWGFVRDEFDRPVRNSLVEVWQANAGGRYRHRNDSYLAPLDPNFGGAGRTLTDENGRYEFRTLRPGPYPFPNGPNDWRPSHIHFSLLADLWAQRLVTQMYFEGDPLIAGCPIVNTIRDERAIRQLIAQLDRERSVPFDLLAYRFDLVLRGVDATWFEAAR
jgi:protocatechuate 3,4-dioxygenase beta subunit